MAKKIKTNMERFIANQDKSKIERIKKGAKICMVITSDASYSLSPDLHEAAYKELGLTQEFVYIRRSVPEDELVNVVEEFRTDEAYRGISVGVPHKLVVMGLLDNIDDGARQVGAVNTIVIDSKDDKRVLTGYNTDWVGVVNALEEVIDIYGKRVAIIGAGGAARAAIYGIKQKGAIVKIYNRTIEKARTLSEEFGCEFAGLDAISEVGDSEVVINVTKVGMDLEEDPIIPRELIRPGQVIFDAVYSRAGRTRLVREAAESGAIVIPGERMLLHQAVGQFELYTGVKDPRTILAMEKALNAR